MLVLSNVYPEFPFRLKHGFKELPKTGLPILSVNEIEKRQNDKGDDDSPVFILESASYRRAHLSP